MSIKFSLNANLVRPISGKLKTSVKLMRTIAGLNLEVGCFLINGVYIGSCNYTDLCEFVRTLSTKSEVNFVFTSLFQTFFDFDNSNHPICPIKAEVQETSFVNTINLPSVSNTALSFLMSGDYNLTVSILEENSGRNVGCWWFVYTMKK